MKPINLVKNTCYMWNDPDNDLCSKHVIYVGGGDEPYAVYVEDNLKNRFSVYINELSYLED